VQERGKRVEGDAPRYKSGRWRAVFPAPGFEPIDERHAGHTHSGSVEQVVVERTLSVSFIAALPADQRRAIEQRVRALVEATPELAGQATVAFPYETAMFAFRTVSEP
jgi:hypothetical protein